MPSTPQARNRLVFSDCPSRKVCRRPAQHFMPLPFTIMPLPSHGTINSMQALPSSMRFRNEMVLDQLEFKILGVWMTDVNPPFHTIKVSFVDNVLISAIIKPYGLEDRSIPHNKDKIFARGTLNYDPTDFENICLLAGSPLIVTIQPETNVPSRHTYGSNNLVKVPSPGSILPKAVTAQRPGKNITQPPSQQRPVRSPDAVKNISCCNIDILPLFLDQDNICVKTRLQPMRVTSYLKKKSWDNLPLLIMSVTAIRQAGNARYHQVLQNATWMKITMVGAYNLKTPYNCDCYYTAATKMPIQNPAENEMVMYVEGINYPRKFNSTSFYPRWESLRSEGEPFTKNDDKLKFDIDDIYNPEGIDLDYYLNRAPQNHTAIWGSFHRSLLLEDAQSKLWNHLIKWKWPLEVHYYGDVVGGFSFMGFMDLFKMTYPGVRKMVMAVPLHWFNWPLMGEECNCQVLLMPNEKIAGSVSIFKPVHPPMDSSRSTTIDDEISIFATGTDDKPAFVLVEVQFSHPMIPEVMPPYILKSELMQMLAVLDSKKAKRACRARGQQSVLNWQYVVRSAANSLRRVPHHGLTDISVFNRQLSESRTRVELVTSFWMEAALFVNNNFVVTPYLESEDTFKELLMMAHVTMMEVGIDYLVGKDHRRKIDPTLRAARHARQVNDLQHAVELYFQTTTQVPYDGDCWRELATCLKDIDVEWAAVCLNKSLIQNIRHPLTLLAQSCIVFEKNPDAAEPFFMALLNIHPFWPTANIACIAYFHYREFFRLSDKIKNSLLMLRKERLVQDLPFPRSWEHELGDFWDPTVILPGMSIYYDVVDLLLRIRGIALAEVCLGMALAESGETAVYYHLLAICCRLKGDFEDSLCFTHKCVELFGQNTALRSLEGECYHHLEDLENAKPAFEKAKGGSTPYNIMLSLPCWEVKRIRNVLVELLRRQPSAYAWMALAYDWIVRSQMEETEPTAQSSDAATPAVTAIVCTIACAVQALKWDRRAARAWALLSQLVEPQKRRHFCAAMAADCGYSFEEDTEIRNLKQHSQKTMCQRFGTAFKNCHCALCELVPL